MTFDFLIASVQREQLHETFMLLWMQSTKNEKTRHGADNVLQTCPLAHLIVLFRAQTVLEAPTTHVSIFKENDFIAATIFSVNPEDDGMSVEIFL